MYEIFNNTQGKAMVRRLSDKAECPPSDDNPMFRDAMAWFKSQNITPDLTDKAPIVDPNLAKVAQAKQTIKNNWSTMTPVEKALAILLQAD